MIASTGSDTSRSVLRDRRFVRLWCGTTASGLATWALPFVLGLAVLDRGLTAAGLGIVLAARTAGFLLAVPISGVLADRYSRRAVVWWAGLAAALATPFIALGLGRSIPLMTVAAAVVGAGQGACRPAFQALTAEVVDAGRRRRANAAMTLAVRVTTLVAPAGTALLAAVLDTWWLLIGTGLLWLAAAVLPPRGLPAPARTADSGRFLAEFGEGVREARRHPWFLAGLGALAAVVFTGYSATSVALPLVSRDHYGAEVVLAAALTAYTLGALAGALLVARWQPRAQGWTALAGLSLYGFAPLSLLLPAHPAAVFAAYVLAGLGIELFNVPWFTATQREVEPRLLARVSSLDFLVSYGLAPLGLAFLAPAVDAFGRQPVLAGCALVCFLAPAAAALAPGSHGFSRSERSRRGPPAT
ncbi:putative MFS family arabinose efflux permease [Nonomuraea fuscirosea]|uniref:Putative MFS family arabinose efflux permease n=1 Tax=Nonomuraea fuscirosea TaxID=1291556 RepID=A0A2T0MQX1_9ACTN|nr:MFS transporter [Nonomuraea fuscirosea]PRX60651.1 putative MFS family arabinose efflux permease [Nonomuraea fuscirosea]